MTASHPGHENEYPQAIADDYPGWGVTREDGQWTRLVPGSHRPRCHCCGPACGHRTGHNR